MNENKIIIRPNIKSFTNIFYVSLGIFFLAVFFCLLAKNLVAIAKTSAVPASDFMKTSFFLVWSLLFGLVFLFAPLGKKITIRGNLVDYQNWLFFHRKIEISAETKIRMGMCRPKWSARPELIWKISNRRGKEKIRIHAWHFDCKKVNEEFGKLAGHKIDFSLADIKF